MGQPVKAGPHFSVEIESLDLDGRGVARRDGKVVFVEGGLPGELVEVELTRSKERFDQARVVRIEREGSLRAQPRCPHFGLHEGACGGCAIQHLAAPAQVALKQRALEDALWHLARVRPEMMLRPIAGPFWHYRHRARMSARFVEKKGGALVGFHERSSSYVADMKTCAVLPERVAAMLPALRELCGALSIRTRMPQIELAVSGDGDAQVIVLVFRVLESPSDADVRLLRDFRVRHRVSVWLQSAGPDTAQPMEDADRADLALALPEFGVRIPFGPTDFTQVNHRVNEVLVRRALRLLDVQPGDRVIDFFCGLGNFTLPLATRAERVLGFEGAESLVKRARVAARDNGLDNAEFAARDLFKWTEADWDAAVRQLGRVDRVLIDPPREGAQAIARSFATTQLRPRRLVYVSCSPATLARDAAILVHEGGWRMTRAGVVNMFPHTSHVESIGVFEPASPA